MGILAKSAKGSLLTALVLSLTACGGAYSDIKSKTAKKRSKEYFAESEYGVKASPRMAVSDYDTTTKNVALVPIPKPIGAVASGQAYALAAPSKSLKRGGGRLSIGKPYKIRGKWYTPADQPGYSREGRASWYGDAFHGRLTANGEIYDMNNLTAAHPTLPLPSYARVTNPANGTSVIVRINDRGPYAGGRVIDLSKRVAHVLDTKHAGVGVVKVDYIGIAPVNGKDDAFLLASFRQNGAGNPHEDMAMYAALTGGGTPSQPAIQAPVMIASVDETGVANPKTAQAFAAVAPMQIALEQLPEPASRPLEGTALRYQSAENVDADRFAGVLRQNGNTQSSLDGWKAAQIKNVLGAAPVEIMVGTLLLDADLKMYAAEFAALGQVAFVEQGDNLFMTLSLPVTKADATLKVLWAAGYKDAFALR